MVPLYAATPPQTQAQTFSGVSASTCLLVGRQVEGFELLAIPLAFIIPKE
ncbi:MAG: hypothetical protein WBP16_14840 [Ferruginibacter sp.]